jgi:uncharacterized protein (UPF0371 family)
VSPSIKRPLDVILSLAEFGSRVSFEPCLSLEVAPTATALQNKTWRDVAYAALARLEERQVHGMGIVQDQDQGELRQMSFHGQKRIFFKVTKLYREMELR